jgi:hypothetical protein
MGEAGAGEALISRAVRDLLSGSDIALEDRGVHLLRASMAIGRCLLSPPCNPVAPVQACIAVSATRSAGGLHTGEVELSDGDVAGSRCCAGDDRAWVG